MCVCVCVCICVCVSHSVCNNYIQCLKCAGNRGRNKKYRKKETKKERKKERKKGKEPHSNKIHPDDAKPAPCTMQLQHL